MGVNGFMMFHGTDRTIAFWLCAASFWLVPFAARSRANDQSLEPNKILIELFVRNDSEQCRQAEQCLARLKDRRHAIELITFDVIEDRDALTRLWQITKRFGHEKAGVPTVYLLNRLIVGFQDDETTGRRIEDLLRVRAFLRPGCRHCQAAKRFLDGMAQRWPALTIEYYNVVADVNARNEVARLVKKYKVRAVSYPCIQAAGRLIVGFQSDATTGRRIERLFEQGTVPKREDGRSTANAGQRASTASASALWRQTHSERNRFSASFGASFPTRTLVQYLARQTTARDASPSSLQILGTPEEPPAADDVPLPDDVPLDEVPFDDLPLPDEVPPPDEAASSEDVPLPDDQILGPAEDVLLDQSSEQPIEVPVFGRLHVRDLGLPAFTFLIGLVDGFNPCAMWVLVFLLSVLVNIKDRKKIIVIAGTFVVVSGLAYFAFMAAWFNVFQLIGLLRPVQMGLGLMAIVVGAINVKDFFAFHKGVTLSIPESAKPGIYRRVREIVAARSMKVALLGAVTLAVVVNIIELLCTAGLPALYTEVLTMQNLPLWMDYSYLALYISAYMLDDAILVTIVVITLSHRKLQESEGRWLKLVSGCVILLLGGIMLLKPDLLV